MILRKLTILKRKFQNLKQNIKLLKKYATKGCEANMIEVMCCEGGCIAGPGCISLAKKAARQVEAYVEKGQNQKDMK